MAFTTIPGSGATDATTFVGSAGVDTLTLSTGTTPKASIGAAQAADIVTLFSPNARINDYTVKGGQGTDTIATQASTLSNAFVNGNSNNDSITVQASFTSTIRGGQGNDTVNANGIQFSSVVNGNKNSDTIAGQGSNGGSLYGGQGTDSLTIAANSTYTDAVINGNKDNDSVSFAGAVTLTRATVEGGEGNDSITTAAAVTATGTTINGGKGNDVLTGTLSVNGIILDGGEGIDAVLGGAGNDTLSGGAGNDNITLAAGNDRLIQTGESTAATVGGATLNGSSLQANSTITFGNGIDIVLDGGSFAAADTVVTGTNAAEVELTTQDVSNLAFGNYTIQGTYVAATGVFTQANAGTDVLVLGGIQGNLATASTAGTSAFVINNAANLAGGGLLTFA